MATLSRDVVTRFLADTAQIKQATTSIAGHTGQMGQSFSRLGTLVKGVIAGQIVSALGDMVKAAAEDEVSMQKLQTVMENTTGATDAQVASVEKWVDKMQIATLIADTELRQSLGNLMTAGLDAAEAQDTLSVAMDIAKARGLELNSVVGAMVRAINSGQTAGLARMGIATKNAAGEMLSFDEILVAATETMGGAATEAAATLGGAMERASIIMEEAREEAGKRASPWWAAAGDAWAGFVELLGTGKTEISDVTEKFNAMIRDGIDPFEDKAASLITVFSQFSTKPTRDQIDLLLTMLGGGKEDLSEARSRIEEYGKAWGLSDEQVKNLNSALIVFEGFGDDVRNELEAQQIATEGAGGATVDYYLAVEELREQQLLSLSPTLGLVNAIDRQEAALRRSNEALSEHGAESEEAEDAAIDVAEAELALEAAAKKFAEEGGQKGIDALRQTLEQAGVARDTIDELIGKLTIYNDTPVTVKKFPFSGGGGGATYAYHEGGVVPGPRGREQWALVEGGETITPAGHLVGGSGGGGSSGLSVNIYPQGHVLTEGDLVAMVIDGIAQARRRGVTV